MHSLVLNMDASYATFGGIAVDDKFLSVVMNG